MTFNEEWGEKKLKEIINNKSGSRYSGTVAMVPFIIQLLECKRVEGKSKLLKV